MNNETDVIVLGAGLTGLSTALFLQNAGISVKICEKSESIGGVIQTHSKDGFTFESGPNTGVLSSTELIELFDILGDNCQPEIANADAKKRWVWKNGKWNALPSGPISAISTPLFSLKDKFRILGEPFRKPGTNPYESVAEMVKRRLGKSFLEYAVDPFISGIYAGDPEKLITKFALPKLYNLEQNYGSFIKGSIKKAKEPKTDLQKRATRDVFSVPGGLSQLIINIAKKIGDQNILTDCKSLKVEKAQTGYSVTYLNEKKEKETINSKYIISTFSANHFEGVFPFINDQMLNNIKNLEYARIVQVAVGYKTWHNPKPAAFGGLVPTKEGFDILGILFLSSIFENRAPENGVLFSVFMGGRKKPTIVDLPENKIKELVLSHVGKMMNVNNLEPDLLEIFKYDHAIPQYEISSEKRMEAIGKIENENPGLMLAGNIRDGIGIADRVKQAKMIADKIVDSAKSV